jgi:hypothetical protein
LTFFEPHGFNSSQENHYKDTAKNLNTNNNYLRDCVRDEIILLSQLDFKLLTEREISSYKYTTTHPDTYEEMKKKEREAAVGMEIEEKDEEDEEMIQLKALKERLKEIEQREKEMSNLLRIPGRCLCKVSSLASASSSSLLLFLSFCSFAYLNLGFCSFARSSCSSSVFLPISALLHCQKVRGGGEEETTRTDRVLFFV